MSVFVQNIVDMINLSTIFPYKDRIDRSQQFRIIYRVNCWGCNGFYIGKTKRRLHDRKTEPLKAPAKNDNTQPLLTTSKPLDIASIKWDHFNTDFGEGQNRLPLQNQRDLICSRT